MSGIGDPRSRNRTPGGTQSRKGAGPLGGGIIVAATLVVGWGCAVIRARTGSVWAPFVAHLLANVASIPGGVVGAIIYRVMHGEFPTMR